MSFMEKLAWQVKLSTGLDELRELKADWLELEAQSGDPYACFQSYAWCWAWAETWCGQASAYTPQIFRIYHGDVLVGLLPMMTGKTAGLRVLCFLGEPHTQTGTVLHKEHLDVSQGLELCLEQMRSMPVDAITLNALPDGSPLALLLKDDLQPDPAEFMAITGSDEHLDAKAYYQSLSRNRKKDFCKKKKRLEEMGELIYRTIPAGDDEFITFAKQSVEMKRRWLKNTHTLTSGLAWKDAVQFAENLNLVSGTYRPEIQLLTLSDQPIAISINMVGKGMRSCYMSAYDLSLTEASPGTVIHQLSMQQSVDEGLLGYNFLGHQTYFKNLWTNQRVPLVRYQQSLTFKGRIWIDLWANRLKPTAKSILSNFHKKPANKAS